MPASACDQYSTWTVFTPKKSITTARKTVAEIITKKSRAFHGSMERPERQPAASATLKQSDATRIGSAIMPEAIIPNANSTVPKNPKDPSASDAVRVVMLEGSSTCICEAATMAESEIRHATNVPACDSVTCALASPSGKPRLELVCHTITSGVSSDPKTATTPIMYPEFTCMRGSSTSFASVVNESVTRYAAST